MPTLFSQLFDPESNTYTYLLADAETRRAVLVDPVAEQVDRDAALLAQLGLRLEYTLETHVHADHVTGASALRQRLGSRSVVSRNGGAPCADLLADHGDRLQVGGLTIEVRATPGHTRGDLSYLVGDRVFTGDALLIEGCGRTDFQEGDAGTLYDSVHGQLFTLPPRTLVYPGHDYQGRTVSTIGHEREHNPRLGGGRTRQAFIALMGDLHLPPPRQIDVAVPRNRACGELPDPDQGQR